MNSLNPKIRFIIFLITTLIIFGVYGWYNYGIYSDISGAKEIYNAAIIDASNADALFNEISNEISGQLFNDISSVNYYSKDRM